MLKKSVRLFNSAFPSLQWIISRRWFEFISTLDSGTAMLFMNYGYAALDSQNGALDLLAEDEDRRYSIQLYHHVANAVDLANLDVIEIGCGRGGGADFIQRYLKPRTTMGIDLSANAIDFCREHYKVPGLSFQQGDAENTQFQDSSFDAVINVESSICYKHIGLFFGEVVRILKPGGYFLYADLRNKEEIDTWEKQLNELPLDKINKNDITPNVFKALDLDNERKQRLIRQYAPKILHKPFNEFAGMKGTRFFYGAFERGEKTYRSYLFRKPNDV